MNTQTPQQLYTYASLAQLSDCAVKTIRNKVSTGQFPRPIQTAFGPRFTADHLAAALTPIQPSADPVPTQQKKRGPGRPRLARIMDSKGGAK